MNDYAEALIKQLEERKLETTRFIGSGGCKSFEEYQRLCGLIQGLEHAQNLISDLAKRMENDDE
jgi:hypothetical protein